jgi:hypothetical protein
MGTMNRYGVPFAPHGCGDAPDGPCEGCAKRAVRGRWGHRVRWLLRQLFPLTYRTRYHTMDGTEWFVVWRMWFGRVFAEDKVAVAPA